MTKNMYSLVVPLVLVLAASAPCRAQSGGAALHGWVAFEGVAYADHQPHATVRLRADPPGTTVYSTQTDEHGFFAFAHASLGRFTLEISARGFRPYSAEVYLASDFVANWAVQLKAAAPDR